MTESRGKDQIVTFKADQALLDALDGVQNRSEFIRNAVHAALENTCPVCRGAGTLTTAQRAHWEAFAKTHPLIKCDDCHGYHFECGATPVTTVRKGARKR